MSALATADLAHRLRAKVLERGIASPEEVARAEAEASERGQSLADALVSIGIATEDQMGNLEAAELGVPYIFPYAGNLDLDLVSAFPADLLRRHEAIPMMREPDHVLVAVPGAPSRGALGDLEAASGMPVRISLASRRRIRTVLTEVLGPEPAPLVEGTERIADPAAVALLYGHLARAIAARASEVRFEPVDGAILVRYRLGGRLEEKGRETLASLPSLVARVKVMSGASPREGAAPGAPPFFGRVDRAAIGGQDLAIEVAVLRTRAGDSILLRLDAGSGPASDLDRAGLPPPAAAALREVAALERGLVLVASWDPRTARSVAYLLGRACDPARRAVLSLEREPLEPEPRFRQISLGDGHVDDALAGAIGHRPDVLLVCEPLDDPRHASALLGAAETALVIAVGWDADGPEAVISWLERGTRPTLLARALRALVSAAPATQPGALSREGREGVSPSRAEVCTDIGVCRASSALREAIERGARPHEIRAAAREGAAL